LRRRDRFPAVPLPERLMPVLEIEGVACLMETPKLAAVPLRIDNRAGKTSFESPSPQPSPTGRGSEMSLSQRGYLYVEDSGGFADGSANGDYRGAGLFISGVLNGPGECRIQTGRTGWVGACGNPA